MIRGFVLFVFFTFQVIHILMFDRKVLVCEIEDSMVIPLFVYQGGKFKSASLIFDESEKINFQLSPLAEFKSFYAYSERGDYIGSIIVNEITYQEVGCVRRVVGRFELPRGNIERPKFCLSRLSDSKKFYIDSKVYSSDSALVLSRGRVVIKDFLDRNLRGYKVYRISFEISQIAKFDIEGDKKAEIFGRVTGKAKLLRNPLFPWRNDEISIITSFIIGGTTGDDFMYLSITCINQDGETIAGDNGVVYFDFVADVDGDLTAEIIAVVGYYESWDYHLLKKFGDKIRLVATASGGVG